MAGDGVNLNREYKRWKDYAQVLFLALTILFTASFNTNGNKTFLILAVVFGLIGVMSVVMWYAREVEWQYKGKPVFLLAASFCIGLQIVFFLFHVIFS